MISSAIPTATFLLLVQCLNSLRYGVINCTKGIDIYCLCATAICITVFTCPAITHCVTVGVGISFLTSHFFKMQINTIVQSTHFSSKLCFPFRFSGSSFVGLFLCHYLYIVSPSRPPYNPVFRPPRHWLIVYSKFRISWLCFKGAETSSTFVLFKVRPSLSVQKSVTTYRAT